MFIRGAEEDISLAKLTLICMRACVCVCQMFQMVYSYWCSFICCYRAERGGKGNGNNNLLVPKVMMLIALNFFRDLLFRPLFFLPVCHCLCIRCRFCSVNLSKSSAIQYVYFSTRFNIQSILTFRSRILL